MTLNQENTPVETQQSSQIDSNLTQQNVDSNITQEKIENQSSKEEVDNQDPNWRAFREARKKDRAEREAAERKASEKEKEIAALKAAMEAAFSAKSSPTPQAYQQYYGMNQQYEPPEETEEQRIERKVEELLQKKQQQYEKDLIEREQREYPQRLSKDFPDIANVCSQENIDYLDYHFPEVSRPLQRLKEGYDKWHDIYHAIKKFIPNHSNFKKEAVKAEINTIKPRSISSTGPSPTGEKPRESWQEIEARRAERWARMQQVMKGV